jgi:hypothetical protein
MKTLRKYYEIYWMTLQKGAHKSSCGFRSNTAVWKFFSMLFLILCLTSCEDADVGMITGAGIDVIKAVTLTDAKVAQLAAKSSSIPQQIIAFLQIVWAWFIQFVGSLL